MNGKRMKFKNNPSAQLEYNIPLLLKKIINSRAYEKDYKDVTHKLLYENLPYEYVVEDGIGIIAESDVFEYKNSRHE